MRKLLFPTKTIRKAKELGLALADLNGMVVKSARITHPKGNRRYHEYLFDVQGDIVRDIYHMTKEEIRDEKAREVQGFIPSDVPRIHKHYRCETCRDTGKMQVFDECEACYGAGCHRCDEGLVPAQVTCPDCTPRDHIGVYQKKPRRYF